MASFQTIKMAMSKSVIKVVQSIEQGEGVGARVRRSIGTQMLRNLDPFLMLDYFMVRKPGGFPDHPHRGQSTVTLMLEGTFQHEDSLGNKGKIGPGDLQWMAASRGIVHAEMPFSEGLCTGLQLWINLPAKAKALEPTYQELKATDVPKAVSPSGGVKVKVIAGSSYGVDAKVHTHSPIYFLDVEMEKNEKFVQSVPPNWTAFLFTLSGSAIIAGQTAPNHATLVLGKEGDTLTVETAAENARFVLIAGEPIGEPIVQHGPFVMNQGHEIREAITDFQTGRNGFEGAPGWKSSIS